MIFENATFHLSDKYVFLNLCLSAELSEKWECSKILPWMTNDEGWMTNAERWIQSLLHDNYDNNTVLWIAGWCMDQSKNFIPQCWKILIKKSKNPNFKPTIFKL